MYYEWRDRVEIRRRSFLGLGLGAAVAGFLGLPRLAKAFDAASESEYTSITFWELSKALKKAYPPGTFDAMVMRESLFASEMRRTARAKRVILASARQVALYRADTEPKTLTKREFREAVAVVGPRRCGEGMNSWLSRVRKAGGLEA